jgi:hypothetical protein
VRNILADHLFSRLSLLSARSPLFALHSPLFSPLSSLGIGQKREAVEEHGRKEDKEDIYKIS